MTAVTLALGAMNMVRDSDEPTAVVDVTRDGDAVVLTVATVVMQPLPRRGEVSCEKAIRLDATEAAALIATLARVATS